MKDARMWLVPRVVASLWMMTFSANAQQIQIKASFKGADAVLTSDLGGFAGAVTSFKWNKAEFINRRDHGRLLQSSVIFDGLGGCFNPTEAGSSSDAAGPTSSSKVLSSSVTATELHTAVQAAFWMSPGMAAPRGCGERTDLHAAVNTVALADYEISKDVSFGYNGIQNSISWVTTFTVPVEHKNADFELLTGYMPSSFSSFYEFSPIDGSTTPLQPPSGTRIRPLIFITRDQKFAMGIVCPNPNRISYAYITFHDTVKWNCVSHIGPVTNRDYHYREIVFFGTFEDVTNGMRTMLKPRGK
jgi:hypothetical protein